MKNEKTLKRNKIINICLIVAFVIILALNIVLSIYTWRLDHKLYLNEYHNQILQFGYYRKDIHLLEQSIGHLKVTAMLVGNVITYILLVIGLGRNLIVHFKK